MTDEEFYSMTFEERTSLAREIQFSVEDLPLQELKDEFWRLYDVTDANDPEAMAKLEALGDKIEEYVESHTI